MTTGVLCMKREQCKQRSPFSRVCFLTNVRAVNKLFYHIWLQSTLQEFDPSNYDSDRGPKPVSLSYVQLGPEAPLVHIGSSIASGLTWPLLGKRSATDDNDELDGRTWLEKLTHPAGMSYVRMRHTTLAFAVAFGYQLVRYVAKIVNSRTRANLLLLESALSHALCELAAFGLFSFPLLP